MLHTIVLEKEFKHAKLSRVAELPHIMIVEASSPYIPIEDFKEIFEEVYNSAAKKTITKLIFDKRNLTVFHQPSMEWYFVDWKERVFELGLKTHRKILPDNAIFKHSVKIGRDKIKQMYPNGKFTLMDIQYSDSIEAAILN